MGVPTQEEWRRGQELWLLPMGCSLPPGSLPSFTLSAPQGGLYDGLVTYGGIKNKGCQSWARPV